MNVLVAYLTYSGNTQEVAELIAERAELRNYVVDLYRIGSEQPLDMANYELIFIGTFTWSRGETPHEVKDFVLEIGYKPETVAVFGTGDTQFGGEQMFCNAAGKLAAFYESRWQPLKIEQSPRGSQQAIVNEWVEGVLNDVNKIT